MNQNRVKATAMIDNVFWAEVTCAGCSRSLHVRYDALKEAGTSPWPYCPACLDASYEPLEIRGKVEPGVFWEGPGVGGRSLLRELQECHYNYQPVRFTMNGTTYRGQMIALIGSQGYSTLTPGEDPTLRVGEHNIWSQVVDLWLEGEEVAIKVERG